MLINQKFHIVGLLVYLAITNGCTPEGQAIHYGEDKCEFCRMTIVDQRFGAEVVTQKGKVSKFDAIECMVNYIDRIEDESKLAIILTNTYDRPGTFTEAASCTYLISEHMPSPMGKYLNAFTASSEAIKQQQQNTGVLLSWKQLKEEFAE